MDVEKFKNSPTGILVPINGLDLRFGEWSHSAFLPNDLPEDPVTLNNETHLQVTNAHIALASLNRAFPQLLNAQFLRAPTLRREAQSTSALEGTYAPLEEVLASDENLVSPDANVREVMNYVNSANYAFHAVLQGRPISLDLLETLQERLIKGTDSDNGHGGKVRSIQVMIGSHPGSKVEDARYVPPPPGIDLPIQVRTLLDWMQSDSRKNVPPVVAAAMAHYQFEALHPFNDGNGRIGRLLIVLQLISQNVLSEPMLSVSEWFEARRAEYYDALLDVSVSGNWDRWIRFFSQGIEVSAKEADQRLTDLIATRSNLRALIDQSSLTSISAMDLVDYALGHVFFGSAALQKHLGLTYGRTNSLINKLIDIGILKEFGKKKRPKLYFSPEVYSIYTR